MDNNLGNIKPAIAKILDDEIVVCVPMPSNQDDELDGLRVEEGSLYIATCNH